MTGVASGVALFDSLADDVSAFVTGMGQPSGTVEFRRVAVTPEQITTYGLPTAPAKKTDRRGGFRGGTVQAEALDPATLAAEVETALRAEIDPGALADTLTGEKADRAALVAAVRRARGGFGG